jgi:hypothetical protein
VVVADIAPEVAVTVTMTWEFVSAALLAVRVRTLALLVGFETHAAVTPPGRAEVTAKLTLPANPASPVTEMVVEPDTEGYISRFEGDGRIEKPGAFNSRAKLVLAVAAPEAPVT